MPTRVELASAMAPNKPRKPGMAGPDGVELVPGDWRQEGPPGFRPPNMPQFDVPPMAPGEDPNPFAPPSSPVPGAPPGLMAPPPRQPGSLEGRTRMPPGVADQMAEEQMLKQMLDSPGPGQSRPSPLEGRSRMAPYVDPHTFMDPNEGLTPWGPPPGLANPNSTPQNAPGGAPPHLTPQQLDEIMGPRVRNQERERLAKPPFYRNA